MIKNGQLYIPTTKFKKYIDQLAENPFISYIEGYIERLFKSNANQSTPSRATATLTQTRH